MKTVRYSMVVEVKTLYDILFSQSVVEKQHFGFELYFDDIM